MRSRVRGDSYGTVFCRLILLAAKLGRWKGMDSEAVCAICGGWRLCVSQERSISPDRHFPVSARSHWRL
jgi:hypothetical protein